MTELFEIVGASHIHSTYSDGTRTIPEIARLAEDAGLDFLMFSDHHTLKPKKDGLEGFYGKTLVLIGYETSDADDINHYLIFNTDDIIPGIAPNEYVGETARRGGLGIIAHPAEKRNTLSQYPPYPWTAWDCDEYHGIEIWNQLSEWMEGLNRWNKLYRFIHPLHSTEKPPPELLSRWDQIALRRKVFALAGIDAHSFIVRFLKIFKVRVFQYKVMLKSLRNHVLIREPLPRDDAPKAGEIIFRAISRGSLFVSNYRRGNAAGTRFWAESGGEIFQMGESVSRSEVVFKAELPLTADIRLIHNGVAVHNVIDSKMSFTGSSPGVYRLEAYRSGHSWIFTNHIHLAE